MDYFYSSSITQLIQLLKRNLILGVKGYDSAFGILMQICLLRLRKCILGLIVAIFAIFIAPHTATAQGDIDPRGINFSLPLNDNVLDDKTGNSISLFGAATLTSGAGDLSNDGWLRLTPCQQRQKGYALFSRSFIPPRGVLVEFDYKIWKDVNYYPIGDGMSVFLYDGKLDKNQFEIFGTGASLGYARCQSCNGNTDALTEGYVGIGLDVYGAFSNARAVYDGSGDVDVPNAIVIRGKAPDTKYISGTSKTLGNASDNQLRGITLGNPTPSNTRPTDTHRRVRFFLTPGTRNGDEVDMNITVQLQTAVGGPFYTVIKDKALNQPVFVNAANEQDVNNKSFKIGFAASTGDAVAYHEIRNLLVSAPMNLTVNNMAVGAPALHVGDQIQYQTTISNVGTVSVDTFPAMFTVVTNGVDIPDDITVNITKNALAANAKIVKNTVLSTPGSQVYQITGLPSSGAITLTYGGTISDTNASAINNARIVPPNGFGNTDPNDGRGVAQTFIIPELKKPNNVAAVCPNVALGKTFSSTPTLFTQYTWTRSDGGAGGPAVRIDDLLTNNTDQNEVITYTVTPQIITPIINTDGSVGANNTTAGGAQTFTITVIPTAGGATTATVTVSAINDGTNLILTPTNTLTNPIFTWYKDANKTGGSIGVGTLTVSLGSTVPALKAGSDYTYFVAVSTPSTCESNIYTGVIKVPESIQPITLTFVNVSRGAITNVNGGSDAYLMASLPKGVTAPAGGITIMLSRVIGSSAVLGTNYTNLIGTLTIAAGQTSSTIKAFSAQNAGVIDGSTFLALTSTVITGYSIRGTPSITINDISGG